MWFYYVSGFKSNTRAIVEKFYSIYDSVDQKLYTIGTFSVEIGIVHWSISKCIIIAMLKESKWNQKKNTKRFFKHTNKI